MANRKSEYFGKQATTTEKLDLLQQFKLNPSDSNLVASIFNFIPTQSCSVVINGSDPIPFPAGREFVIDTAYSNHKPLWQFEVQEADIDYWCMGIFK